MLIKVWNEQVTAREEVSDISDPMTLYLCLRAFDVFGAVILLAFNAAKVHSKWCSTFNAELTHLCQVMIWMIVIRLRTMGFLKTIYGKETVAMRNLSAEGHDHRNFIFFFVLVVLCSGGSSDQGTPPGAPDNCHIGANCICESGEQS